MTALDTRYLRRVADDEDRPPICPVCGVTMLPAALSAHEPQADWICVECEEADEPD